MSCSYNSTVDSNSATNNQLTPAKNPLDAQTSVLGRKNHLVNDFIRMMSKSDLTDMNTINNSFTTSSIMFQSEARTLTNNLTTNDLNGITNNTSFDALSEIEQSILRSNAPIEINELDEITINGEHGIWLNKSEVINWKPGSIPLSEYQINEDPYPEKIIKQFNKQLEYVQVLAFRYLKPPTPPLPGEIIIKEETNYQAPPAPPLVIRQLPPRPQSPEPLVIRERPPLPPPRVGRKIIRISGRKMPPPPRKVVIERLAQLPPKPQSAIVERWLPYNANLKRKVIYQRAHANPVVIKPKNVIIQWEPPQVVIRKQVKYLGTIRADPVDYIKRFGDSLVASKDLPHFVKEVKTPENLVLAADYEYKNVYELEGDLHALKLVDLEKEGLGEYRAQLDRSNHSKTRIKFEKARLKTFNPLSSPSRTTLDDTHSIKLTESHTNTTLMETNETISGDTTYQSSSTRTSKDFSAKTSNMSSDEQNSEGLDLCANTKTFPSGTLLSLSEQIKKQQEFLFNQLSISSRKSITKNLVTSSDESSSLSDSRRGQVDPTMSAIDKLFSELDKNKSGRISVQEAEKNFLRFNERLGKLDKNFNEHELLNRIRMLKRTQTSTLSIKEFREDFKRLFF